ncbi:MAG: SDR family NAD(P)-dependent oxidoreductase [Candidatus Aminicenantes bacterium]|nr:SDR family NAD(P)-dependent oxidoreductase [Candidatus Aminicenantes bacterium]
MSEIDTSTGLEIAVTGMSGRFPGAANIDEFRQNLLNGVESISFFSDEELREAGYSEEQLKDPNFVKASGLMKDSECFDSEFFGYTPDEAEVMDPQARVFHECAWNALENAACDPAAYKGLIGLYAGASPNFNWEAHSYLTGKAQSLGFFRAGHLMQKDFLCGLISYKLDLKGPSFFMYTACSTSLVAVHLACQALLNGECDTALAGGVTVLQSGKGGYYYQEGMIRSPDGHCRAFDVDAQGIVGGDGAAVVVLKRLQDALDDRDYIHAVIKGSAINNDGLRKVGFTAPSVEGQAQVIKMAQQLAEVEAESIGYIEAHGTGTNLGDPVEIAALKLAFNTDKRHFCGISALKSNVGHLDSAAGIAGFIKAVLALKEGKIPPTVHFTKANPKLELEDSPFYIAAELAPWKTGSPLRAGVSSFGIGGTNAHVILEEFPDRTGLSEVFAGVQGAVFSKSAPCPPEASSQREAKKGDSQKKYYHLLPLSAKSPAALDRSTRNLAVFLEENQGIPIANAAYTLQVGRAAFNHRRMIVCTCAEDAAEILNREEPGKLPSFTINSEEKKPLFFMFSGQGSQYVNMGLDLYEQEPLFRREMDNCFDILKKQVNLDFKSILYPDEPGDQKKPGTKPRSAHDINRTYITQPVLFALEYALGKLLMSWGMRPGAMIGHSIGEYAAACFASVFSLEDALELVALRGKLMQELPSGSMLSVPLSEKELAPLLTPGKNLSLAAVNSPGRCVVSGPHEAIEAFAAELSKEDRASRRLKTSHAFHSAMMDPILETFTAAVGKMKPGQPQLPFVSNVSGTWITPAQAQDPAYWAGHIRGTVRFAAGLEELLKEENAIFVEVGPGKTLFTFARQQELTPRHYVTALLPHPGDEKKDGYFFRDKIGRLWLHGQEIDWARYHEADETREGRAPRRIPLPGYPFEPVRYSPGGDPFSLAARMLAAQPRDTLERSGIEDWYYLSAWQESALPEVEAGSTEKKTDWLLFIDDCGFGARFGEFLTRQGHSVVTVEAGTQFAKRGSSGYIIDPGQESHFDTLFGELKAAGTLPGEIIHAWGVTGRDEELDLENLDRFRVPGLYSLLSIVQAIGSRDIPDEMVITVVTDGMRCVTGRELVNPAKAAMIGAVKIIPLEYANIKCRSIDIVTPAGGSAEESGLFSLLLQETEIPVTAGIEIAYRQKQRWERVYEAQKMEKPAASQTRLKEKGVYLIIGGFGGMGSSIAEHLAGTYKARLILTGRTALPERETWPEQLKTLEKEDSAAVKIRGVLKLEEQGAEVITAAADTADLEQMRQVVERAEQRFGPINGVIHTAGVIDYGGIIRKRTREITHKYMASKMEGTLVLAHIFKNKNLDFLSLFSSTGSVLYRSKFGQVSYNAANEFIEAYAQRSSVKGGPQTFSINWCDWWDVGMSIRSLQEYHKKDSGEVDYNAMLNNGVFPAEGVDAFCRILASEQHRVTVSPYDLNVLIRQQFAPPAAAQENEAAAGRRASRANLRQRPGLSAGYVEPRGEIEEKLARIWQDFFGVGQIGVLDDFYELGGDSLRLLSLIGLIKKEMNYTISLSNMMLYPNIREMAANIHEETLLNKLECVVRLNRGVHRRNIFILHPLHGMVAQYRELARLLEGRFNVFGIQAKGMLKETKMPETMDELVDNYIREILTIQEEGPYIISGHCFGDMIGYYLIKRLEDKNKKVEKFIMMDDIAFIPPHVVSYYRQARIIDFILKPFNMILDPFKKRKDKKIREAQLQDEEESLAAAGSGGEGETAGEENGAVESEKKPGREIAPEKLRIRAKMNVHKINRRYWLGSAYKRTTGIVKAPILNIKARETHFLVIEEEMKKMTLGKFTLVEIPGDHNNLFQYPQVERLAEVFKEHLPEETAVKKEKRKK